MLSPIFSALTPQFVLCLQFMTMMLFIPPAVCLWLARFPQFLNYFVCFSTVVIKYYNGSAVWLKFHLVFLLLSLCGFYSDFSVNSQIPQICLNHWHLLPSSSSNCYYSCYYYSYFS